MLLLLMVANETVYFTTNTKNTNLKARIEQFLEHII